MKRCSSCSDILVENFNKGICYCQSCGMVSDLKTYTTQSEGFSNEGSSKENTERSGSPTNLIYNKNFLQDDFETRNLPLDLSEKIFFNKLRYWHRRISNTPVDNAEKVSNKTYTILSNVAGTMSLTRDFQKRVLEMQEKLSLEEEFKDCNLRNLLCSICFHLIRTEGINYSFSEVVSSFNVSRKNVAKTYREVTKHMQKKKDTSTIETVPGLIEDYAQLFVSLSPEVRSEVVSEAEELYEAGESLFSIKIPSKIAKAILCQVLHKKKLFNLKDSCKILSIPETTVLGTGPIKEIFKDYLSC